MARQRKPSGWTPGGSSNKLVQSSNQDELQLVTLATGLPEISVTIPESATLKQIEETLAIAINGYKKLSEASERLKPIIGRILLTVSDRKLFRPEFENFTTFVEKRVVAQMGFGRSNAFDALRIAKAFPTMDAAQYQRYGASRLLAASQITSEADPNYLIVLNDSTRQTVEQFKEHVATEKGKRNPSTSSGSVVIAVRCAPLIRDQWQNLLEQTQLAPSDLLAILLEHYKPTKKAIAQLVHRKAS